MTNPDPTLAAEAEAMMQRLVSQNLIAHEDDPVTISLLLDELTTLLTRVRTDTLHFAAGVAREHNELCTTSVIIERHCRCGCNCTVEGCGHVIARAIEAAGGGA